MYQAAREAISASNGSRGKKRTADDAEVPAAAGAASQGATFVEAASPIVHAKAIKNDAELAGFREAHTRDAVAMCDFLCFLETQVRDYQQCTCMQRVWSVFLDQMMYSMHGMLAEWSQ